MLKTFEQRLGYAYGVEVAKSFRDRGVPIDPEAFLQAFADFSDGKTLAMSKTDAARAFRENERRLTELQLTGKDRQTVEAGRKFLAEKAADPKVTKTESGLLYEVLTPASGPKPSATSSVVVKYKGTLIDGTLFDTSATRGGQSSFNLLKVVRGWQEGLQLMSVGSKYRFYVPQYLAYRNAKVGSKIAPYSTLIFEIELLSIEE